MSATAPPLGIIAIDLDGRITGINRDNAGGAAMFNRRGGDLLNVFHVPCFVESGIAEDFRRCLHERLRIVSDRLQPGPEGEPFYFRYHLSPIADGRGLFSGVMAFVEDITDLKRTGGGSHRERGAYRLLFRSAPIALLERDASELKTYLDGLRASGLSMFGST